MGRLFSNLRLRLVLVIAASSLPALLLIRAPLSLALVAFLAPVVAWLLGELLLVRRIRRLANVARRLTSGDTGARSREAYDRGELGQLARAFDDMADFLVRRERKLREAETRFRTLVEEVPAAIYVAGPDGARLYVSPQTERLFGHPANAWTSNAGFWREHLHSEDAERVRAEFERSVRGPHPFASEYRVMAAGGRPIWCRDTGVPIRDEQGQTRYVRGFLVDITERKQLEQEFLQAQKMDAVGRLASGIAHDFNNFLTVILGYGQLLMSSSPSTELREICNAAQTAAELTRQLLAFSRKQVARPSPIHLNETVERMKNMLQRTIGDDVALVTSLAPDIGRILADPHHIEQVLMNLAINARDAMPRGGSVCIETADADFDETYVRMHPGARPGPHVMLAVSDTGCGMDPATLARLFEPFFTTKEKGKGTGLGLSVVYGIVRQSDGHIIVKSAPDQGTAFRLFFPRIAPDPPDSDTPRPPSTPAQKSGTILVVDDEDSVRLLVATVLRQHGYSVLEARDVTTAIASGRQHADQIDLLITDLVLPDGGGLDVVRALSADRPDLRVLHLSGCSVHSGLTPEMPFLEKPFTRETLLRKVGDLIEATPPKTPAS
ncbi:MAG: PAS domain S-box protein [Planctomycetes bacterium]|nr:PAS domain S-box protein [Planctomycetota bacterium]